MNPPPATAATHPYLFSTPPKNNNTQIYCNANTPRAARVAAGCAAAAAGAVLDGAVRRAFAAVRPPGHHATKGQYMGFCFYGNCAVAAHAALARGLERVLIFDW